MNLGSSIVKTSQDLEIAPSYSQLQCLHPASTSRLSVLDQDFFPDLSCFRSKAVLKIRPSTCAWKATTAGLASTTIDALIAGLMAPWHIGTAHSEPCPFGTLPGLETDFGITNVPEKLFGWKYESGTGRNTKWVMTSEVKVPSFSAKSRLLDPNPPRGPPSIQGA